MPTYGTGCIGVLAHIMGLAWDERARFVSSLEVGWEYGLAASSTEGRQLMDLGSVVAGGQVIVGPTITRGDDISR